MCARRWCVVVSHHMWSLQREWSFEPEKFTQICPPAATHNRHSQTCEYDADVDCMIPRWLPRPPGKEEAESAPVRTRAHRLLYTVVNNPG